MEENEIQWELDLQAVWETVDYEFPNTPSSLPEGPAIYCWCVDEAPVYVGQAERLKRRMQHYRSPGPTQQTNLRMKAYLEDQRAAGKAVKLKVLGSIRLNGQPVPSDVLSQKWLRSLLEAWCVWRLVQDGYSLSNL